MSKQWISQEDKDYRLLRFLCIFGGLFSPIITGISMYNSPLFIQSVIVALFFSVLFFLILIFSFKSEYVRRNAYYVTCIISYLATASSLLSSYLIGYTIQTYLVVLLVSLSIILIFKNLRHLAYYVAYIMILNSIILYTHPVNDINKWLYIAFLAMFSIIAYVYVKIRLEAQEALKKSEEDNRNILEVSPQAIVLYKKDAIIYANPVTAGIFRAETTQSLIGKSFLDFVQSEDKEKALSRMKNVNSLSKHDFIEQKMVRFDGQLFDAEVNIMSIKYSGEILYMSIINDITVRKEAERRLVNAESQYRNLVESALVGVYLYENGYLTYVNPYLQNLLGYTKNELFSMKVSEIFFPEDRTKALEVNAENPVLPPTELRIIKKDGNIITVETHASLYSQGNGNVVIGTLVDITHLRKTEEKIKYMAYHDALTGLPNRHMLVNKLDYILSEDAEKANAMSVLFIDLDRFKNINDKFGHRMGDILLKKVAERLKRCVRKYDIVSRYGGDEFVLILKNSGYEETTNMAKRILNSFANPFEVTNVDLFISPSIGISFFPEDGKDSDTLIKNADAAMYLAKNKGKNNFQFYSNSLNISLSRKMELETALRKALPNKEFELYYQPQIDLSNSRISGMEALIRWKHPSLGMITPGEFIPLAEETGLIISIGEWVLNTACKQNKEWQEKGFPIIPVSVNVSGLQFQAESFINTVKNALDQSGLAPICLAIEITENILQEIGNIDDNVKSLINLGVKISIDDFGKGYSSLTLLKSLSVNSLKLDPSFVKDMDINPNAEALIKSIISMGHNLGFNIIAEGVEEKSQMRVFQTNNCDLYQGFYFSKPMPANDIEALWFENLSKNK